MLVINGTSSVTNDGQRAAEIISLYFGDEQLSHSRRAMPFNPRDHRYSQSQSMMMTSRQNGAVVSFVNGLVDGSPLPALLNFIP
jgi:hypothetical protein